MASSIPLLCFSFLLLLTATQAIDIVKILQENSDLLTFSKYLQQTKVADEINKRKTVTVLALDNANIVPLKGKSLKEIKKILMSHVLLGYYDQNKLKKMPNNTSIATLYRTSGSASGKHVSLKVSNQNKYITLGDAVVVKEVSTTPYTFSLLQVNSFISLGGGVASPASAKGTTTATPKGYSNSNAATTPTTTPPKSKWESMSTTHAPLNCSGKSNISTPSNSKASAQSGDSDKSVASGHH